MSKIITDHSQHSNNNWITIVNCRLRDERGEERGIGNGGNDMDGKMRSQSPRGRSPSAHSPVLNLSKSGNERDGNDSRGAPSDRSDHSPNPSIRDDEDNISNVSEVDEHNDKDDDGEFISLFSYSFLWLVIFSNQFNVSRN